RGLFDLVEGPLDAVEDAVEHPRSQLHCQWQPCRDDVFADREAARVFVHLYEGRVAVESDDLADQFLLTDPDDVEHPGAHYAFRVGGRPRDALDLACDCLFYSRFTRVWCRSRWRSAPVLSYG